MAEISASEVMKLRKMSGQGMMDCKKALEEAGGNTTQAMEILRKKGLATLAKRADRETRQGIVAARKSEDGNSAALVTLCCETDFVARSEDFLSAADKAADSVLAAEEAGDSRSILETQLDGKKLSDVLTELVSKTGEKVEIGECVKFSLDEAGFISTYIHFNKKIGTLVKVSASNKAVADSEEIKKMATDIAMHVAATKPLALDKGSIEPEIVEREKAIYADQMKDKPDNIIEKIVQGKLKKFFSENCLLEQPFIKDDSKTVRQVIDDAAKKVNGEAEVTEFARFGIG